MPLKYLDSFFNDSFFYSGVQSLDEIAQSLNLPKEEILKLNANENPYGFPQDLLALAITKEEIAHYPDPAQKKLRQKIASYTKFEADWLLAGNGSDEIIDLLCRFLPQNSSVMIFPPTFSYYEHLIRLNRHTVVTSPRKEDFSIDLAQAKKWKNNLPNMVFLCSPNNPTANLLSQTELQFFLSWDALIVVDEAYFEFSQTSYSHLLKKHKNLVILRTFAKFFGLAGLRLGYAMMQPSLQKKLLTLKYPYNVNQIADSALEVCLSYLTTFQKQRKEIIQTRKRVLQALQTHHLLTPYPSKANFILCKVKNYSAATLSEQLYQKGVLIRYFKTDLLKDFIRISIGKPQQMEKFLKILFTILRNTH